MCNGKYTTGKHNESYSIAVKGSYILKTLKFNDDRVTDGDDCKAVTICIRLKNNSNCDLCNHWSLKIILVL